MNTKKPKTVDEVMREQGYTKVHGVWFRADGVSMTPSEIVAVVKQAQRMTDDVALGNPRIFSFLRKKRGPK